AQDVGDAEFNGPIVPNDDDAAGDGDFTIGESVESVDELVGANAGWGFDLNLDVFGRVIIDAFDLDLAFARSVLDGTGKRFGGRGGRDFLDDDGRIVLDFDFGADLDFAGTILIAAGVHEAASLEVG